MTARALLHIAAVFGLVLAPAGAAQQPGPLGIGTPASIRDVKAWDIDVAPDGRGLPDGAGSVGLGERVYAAKCRQCHGAPAQSDLTRRSDPRAVGTYWPYATTLFDYIRRAMPQDKPQSLRADEVYSLTAFLLAQQGIVPRTARLDRISLPRIAMPNRRGFISRDPRPDVP